MYNYDKMSVWELKRLAEQNDVEAQYQLGEYYDLEEKNIPEANKWYEKAARQNHTESQYMLGYYYQWGGTNFPADIEKGRFFLTKAAEKGHTRAQRHLGILYENERNYVEAAKWYSKAIVHKDKTSMYRLARLYEFGALSSSPYPDCIYSAAKLYEELSSTSFNHKGAMINLARIYRDGKIPRNIYKSKELIERSKLFVNNIVQLDEDIEIYELYQLSIAYFRGDLNVNNEPTIDDINKCIQLLDIVIDDGLKAYPGDLEVAKELQKRAFNIKMHNILTLFCDRCLNKNLNEKCTFKEYLIDAFKYSEKNNNFIGLESPIFIITCFLKDNGCKNCNNGIAILYDRYCEARKKGNIFI